MPIDIFTPRAVLPNVAGARRYKPYEKGDRDTVLGVDARLGMPDLAGWLSAAINPVGGWVLPKFAVMPDHAVFGARPYAQLRPDRPVMPRVYGHHHDGMLHGHRDDPKLQRRRGTNRGRCYCGVTHADPGPPFLTRRRLLASGWEAVAEPTLRLALELQ